MEYRDYFNNYLSDVQRLVKRILELNSQGINSFETGYRYDKNVINWLKSSGCQVNSGYMGRTLIYHAEIKWELDTLHFVPLQNFIENECRKRKLSRKVCCKNCGNTYTLGECVGREKTRTNSDPLDDEIAIITNEYHCPNCNTVLHEYYVSSYTMS